MYCTALHRNSGSMPTDIRKKLPGTIAIMFKGAWDKVYRYNSAMLNLMFQYSLSSLLGAMWPKGFKHFHVQIKTASKQVSITVQQ